MPFSWTQLVDAIIEYRPDAASPAEPVDDDLTVEDSESGGAGEQASSRAKRSRVVFGLRAGSSPTGGYVRVWGPSADASRDRECHVILHRYNGAVVLSRDIGPHVAQAVDVEDKSSVLHHPRGHAAGPFGPRFRFVVEPAQMGAQGHYTSPAALLAEIAQAFTKAGLRW